jgi:hypothetical protein
MSIFLGQPVLALQTANLVVNSAGTGVTLQNTALSIPIAANQKMAGFCRVPIAVAGAASGAKFQLTVPAAGVTYQVEYQIINGSTQAVAIADNILTSGPFSNALANIADHYMFCTFYIANGATLGSVTLQFAQLVADAANTTLYAGATMHVTKF